MSDTGHCLAFPRLYVIVQHERARRSLCERMRPFSLPAGHDACEEGDDCDKLWMLTEGKILPDPHQGPRLLPYKVHASWPT